MFIQDSARTGRISYRLILHYIWCRFWSRLLSSCTETSAAPSWPGAPECATQTCVAHPERSSPAELQPAQIQESTSNVLCLFTAMGTPRVHRSPRTWSNQTACPSAAADCFSVLVPKQWIQRISGRLETENCSDFTLAQSVLCESLF